MGLSGKERWTAIERVMKQIEERKKPSAPFSISASRMGPNVYAFMVSILGVRWQGERELR